MNLIVSRVSLNRVSFDIMDSSVRLALSTFSISRVRVWVKALRYLEKKKEQNETESIQEYKFNRQNLSD